MGAESVIGVADSDMAGLKCDRGRRFYVVVEMVGEEMAQRAVIEVWQKWESKRWLEKGGERGGGRAG